MVRLDQLVQDARFGLRQLVRSPLVATVAILTLAIGIGLNTAVFTLNADPIGRSISGSFLSGTIVGVAHDFAYAQLDGEARPELYYPWQRSPNVQSLAVAGRMSESAVPVVRRLVQGIDYTQPVYQFQTLEQSLSDSVAPRRFNMLLLELYAGAAVIMALAGTFGVVARTVSRRTRETAVRIAVGARPAAVAFMIVRANSKTSGRVV
jgi:hypothetical protein